MKHNDMNTTTWISKDMVKHGWYVVDATNIPLGRLATNIAKYLIGKHKPSIVGNIDVGDYIIIINGNYVDITGTKSEFKEYLRYTGYPSGLKIKRYHELKKRNVGIVIKKAVMGMLPKNKLQSDRINRLFVYSGTEHPHQAQKPINLKFNKKHGSKN